MKIGIRHSDLPGDNSETPCPSVDLGRAAPGAAFDTGQGYDVVDRTVTNPPLATGGRCAPCMTVSQGRCRPNPRRTTCDLIGCAGAAQPAPGFAMGAGTWG
ncbi:hypothetical protein BJF84_26560 [Rhodococcus sp. CUA-806]|nr:hypothetical protein BJF84_26560 [Rhodococcus sp. CUA-806]